ncbi:hypothetical protein WME98_46975 [Sorangium sp. So ce296]|uniref:hypothetical protein n=1 Tax=Sorangium sp. So ce296 TaxID=3133296 RepID=UPI003F5D866A
MLESRSRCLLSVLCTLGLAGCAMDAPDPSGALEEQEPSGTSAEALTASPGEHLWSRRFGGALDQLAEDVALDPQGNLLVVGRFSGSLVLDGLVLTSAGGADVFAVKINAGGVPLWARRFGGAADEGATLAAVDDQGEVVIHVVGSQPVDFGGGPVETASAALIKLDATGSHVWSRSLGAVATALAVDGTSHVLVAGTYTELADLGLGPMPAFGSDIFVARLDAGGTTLSSWRFGAEGNQVARAVAADSAGNVILAGDFNPRIFLGGEDLYALGSRSAFLAKLDAGGFHVWSQMLPSDSWYNSSVNALAVDGADNIVATGWDGGGGASGRALSVFKVAPDGAVLWSRFYWGTPAEPGDDAVGAWPGRSIGTDAEGNVVVATDPTGINPRSGLTIDLGGGPLPFGALLLKLDSSGDHVWSRSWARTSRPELAVAPGGRVFVGGSFTGTLDCGGWPLTSAGGADMFLAKLAP